MSEGKPFGTEPQPVAPPPRSSPWKWVFIGCGGIVLVTLLVCCGGTIWGYSWVQRQVAQFSEEFVAKGYEQHGMSQVVEISESPQQKTVYAAQVITVKEDVQVDIAVIAQVMEVKADIHGDVDFLGQVLKVDAGNVIHGDLRVKNAQVVQIDGEVKGKISGNYMTLLYKNQAYGPGQTPPELEPEKEVGEEAVKEASADQPPTADAADPPASPASEPDAGESGKKKEAGEQPVLEKPDKSG